MSAIQIGNHVLSGNNIPSKCPVCNHYISPKKIAENFLIPRSCEVVFKCTKPGCESLFIGYFRMIGQNPPFRFEYIGAEPSKVEEKVFNEEINKISPNFSTIYNQAYKAEIGGLDQICGVGYRKSLEFLIKDYLIDQYPEREEEIKKKLLGSCIKDLVTDVRIKMCAERAAWLGNDETHYIKKWENKDVTHLKELIDLTIHWISSELITRKYMSEMQ